MGLAFTLGKRSDTPEWELRPANGVFDVLKRIREAQDLYKKGHIPEATFVMREHLRLVTEDGNLRQLTANKARHILKGDLALKTVNDKVFVEMKQH